MIIPLKLVLCTFGVTGVAIGGCYLYVNRNWIFKENKENVNGQKPKESEGGSSEDKGGKGAVKEDKAPGKDVNVKTTDSDKDGKNKGNGGSEQEQPNTNGGVSNDEKKPKESTNSVTGETKKDYQCKFEEGKDYADETNKKAIKEFLDEKGKLGLQILEDNGGFKCAKDYSNDDLAGLSDYLKGEKNISSGLSTPKIKGDTESVPLAVKKSGNTWTIFESSENGSGETLKAIVEGGSKTSE